MTKKYQWLTEVTNFWHSDRGPQWPQNIKNLQISNSRNSFKYFLNFRTLAPNISKSVHRTPSILYSLSTKSRAKNTNLKLKPEPEVVYRGRPWPLGPIDWPSRAIRRPYRPKYCKNEHQEAAGGRTGSGNMAETRYFDSATPTSYSTSYTLWGLSLTVTEFAFENANITPG